jgi:hypothetical protein
MATQLGDQDQPRLALACLFASLAQTLGEQDKAFVPNFEHHLRRMYDQVKDHPSDPMGALETLRWTAEITIRRADVGGGASREERRSPRAGPADQLPPPAPERALRCFAEWPGSRHLRRLAEVRDCSTCPG